MYIYIYREREGDMCVYIYIYTHTCMYVDTQRSSAPCGVSEQGGSGNRTTTLFSVCLLVGSAFSDPPSEKGDLTLSFQAQSPS